VPGRASGVKMVGAPISLDGVAVHPDCSCVSLCYINFAPENPEDDEQRYDIWVSLRGCPTCLCKQEVGKPSWNAAQPCARSQGYANDDRKSDGLQKGWGFGVGTWNVDSVTGRTGEVVGVLLDRKVVWHAFKKHDGNVVVASYMELKAKDISCSGWEVRRDARRDQMVQGCS